MKILELVCLIHTIDKVWKQQPDCFTSSRCDFLKSLLVAQQQTADCKSYTAGFKSGINLPILFYIKPNKQISQKNVESLLETNHISAARLGIHTTVFLKTQAPAATDVAALFVCVLRR